MECSCHDKTAMKYEIKLSSLIFSILCMIVLTGCLAHPLLTVKNSSTAELSKFVVSGNGFSKDLGTVAAGAHKSIAIIPSGESGMQVDFDANGRHYSSKLDCYFENSPLYSIAINVGPDLSVKADVSIRP